MERIIHGDVLSPILAYMRLKGQHKVILESIPRDKETARFSILAYNPVFEIKFENGVLYQNGQVIDRDPLDFLYEVTYKSQHHSGLPFGGGAIGFVGYDMISLYEEIGQIPEDTMECQTCISSSMRVTWSLTTRRKKSMSSRMLFIASAIKKAWKKP